MEVTHTHSHTLTHTLTADGAAGVLFDLLPRLTDRAHHGWSGKGRQWHDPDLQEVRSCGSASLGPTTQDCREMRRDFEQGRRREEGGRDKHLTVN